MEEIVNRVAKSPIITLDLADYYHPGARVVYDLKDNLFQGMILREKDFREFIKNHNWEVYSGKNVALYCSADAIVPTWAYMLLTTKIAPVANMVVHGSLEELEKLLFKDALGKIAVEAFRDKPVVIKGCGDLPIPAFAYVEISRLLMPVVKTLMYGEPCSTVPVFKQPKKV